MPICVRGRVGQPSDGLVIAGDQARERAEEKLSL